LVGDPTSRSSARVMAAISSENAFDKAQTSLSDLQDLPFVLSVGTLSTVDAVCCNGLVEVKGRGVQDETGPWHVEVLMLGPEPNYLAPYRVRFTFTSLYPQQAPAILVLGIIYHFDLDEENMPPPAFVESLGGDHSMPHIVGAFRDFLAKPMHPCADCNAKWLQLAKANKMRLDLIRSYAGPCERPLRKYEDLFDLEHGWREEWLDERLAVAMKDPDALHALLREGEVTPGVFSFPMLNERFCSMFLEEMDNYYATGLPIRRPNSMNNYGIIVNEIGMEGMINSLQAKILQPIARMLFPQEGAQLDRHHAFMVQYKVGEDLGLDMHTDDSDVTFNVCLGKDFAGAGLSFCGMMGHKDHRQLSHIYQHIKGTCVVHLGRKRHGADDITHGERFNLIIWNHSKAYRESDDYNDHSRYQTEMGPPSEKCLSYTHDRDYGVYRQYPKGREEFLGSGWCPPRSKEYAGFKAEVGH